jgi:hypothetical protein
MATGGGAIMIAPWLTWLSIVSLVVAAVTAVVIALDLRRHPQSMALMQFGFFTTPPKPDTPVFWFMMQIGMIIGFATTYPVNWVLVKTGIKDAM